MRWRTWHARCRHHRRRQHRWHATRAWLRAPSLSRSKSAAQFHPPATACQPCAAIEFALDPNQDGDTSDAVDVINLSLGSPYGQVEADDSFALDQAVQMGVVVVASAGNSGDRPFIAGSPSSVARRAERGTDRGAQRGDVPVGHHDRWRLKDHPQHKYRAVGAAWRRL